MSTNKISASIAAVAAAGALVVGGVAAANAATTTPAPSTSSSATTQPGQQDQGGRGDRGMPQHTAASAAETTSVKDAVKAKDSTITVTSVQKDADGSFDAIGTKAGQPVLVDVSSDFKTVTVNTGFGGRGGHGAPGTPATAAQTASVKAAVTAKDSAVTVEDVMVDADGSFHVRGTKAGAPVHVEVSKDLKTVTVQAGGRGGHGGGRGGHGGGSQDAVATAAQKASVTAAVKAKDAAVTVTEVRVDPDGSFDAMGTKAGAPVMVEVSKDLKTVEVRTGGPQGGRMGPQDQQGSQGGATSSPTSVPGMATSTGSTVTA